MSGKKPIIILSISVLLAVALAVTGIANYWSNDKSANNTPRIAESKQSLAPQIKAQTAKLDRIRQLAQHHCSKLNPPALAAKCEGLAIKTLNSGNITPNQPEFDANQCAALTDAKQQHNCHGKLGHDFAVSTGDISRCAIIPQQDIKDSCQLMITLNEIKKLYALERPAVTENKPHD